MGISHQAHLVRKPVGAPDQAAANHCQSANLNWVLSGRVLLCLHQRCDFSWQICCSSLIFSPIFSLFSAPPWLCKPVFLVPGASSTFCLPFGIFGFSPSAFLMNSPWLTETGGSLVTCALAGRPITQVVGVGVIFIKKCACSLLPYLHSLAKQVFICWFSLLIQQQGNNKAC